MNGRLVKDMAYLLMMLYALSRFETRWEQFALVMMIVGSVMDLAWPYLISRTAEDQIAITATYRIRFANRLILFSLPEAIMIASGVIFTLAVVIRKIA